MYAVLSSLPCHLLSPFYNDPILILIICHSLSNVQVYKQKSAAESCQRWSCLATCCSITCQKVFQAIRQEFPVPCTFVKLWSQPWFCVWGWELHYYTINLCWAKSQSAFFYLMLIPNSSHHIVYFEWIAFFSF